MIDVREICLVPVLLVVAALASAAEPVFMRIFVTGCAGAIGAEISGRAPRIATVVTFAALL